MFHFETSFCVMGDSWWPRNTLQFFSRASLRMKPLANLVLFFFWISSLALLAHFGRCSEWPNVPHLGILGSAETKNPCFGWRAFRKRQYFPREKMFFPSAMLQSLTCELISAIFGYLLWVSYQF